MRTAALRAGKTNSSRLNASRGDASEQKRGCYAVGHMNLFFRDHWVPVATIKRSAPTAATRFLMIKSYFWAARQLESLVFVNKCKTRGCRTLQSLTDLEGYSALRRDPKAHSGSRARLTRFSP